MKRVGVSALVLVAMVALSGCDDEKEAAKSKPAETKTVATAVQKPVASAPVKTESSSAQSESSMSLSQAYENLKKDAGSVVAKVSDAGTEVVAAAKESGDKASVMASQAMEAAQKTASEAVASVTGGNAHKGEAVFKKCMACHTIDKGGKNKVGPNLFGVYDRAAGSVNSFTYSSLMMAAKDLRWTEANLSAYLENPTAFLRAQSGATSGSSKMTFKLGDAAQRGDVIAYLKITR